MKSLSGNVPRWETRVNQTILELKSTSKSRSLKSHDVYQCVCIFINDHLKKRLLAYATIGFYYKHLKLFSAWLHKTGKATDIRKLSVTDLRGYFSYMENERNYKNTTIEGAQAPLLKFFRSMKLRRLIKDNPMQDFKIVARRYITSASVLTAFDLKMLLQSVKDHCRYLQDNDKLTSHSLFLHRRDLCIVALCIGCGLRNGEIRGIKTDHVDFDRATLLIPGKGNQRVVIKQRTAFFSHPFLQEVLMRYQRMREKLPGDSFFCNCHGDELNSSAVCGVFSRYAGFISENAHYSATITRKSFSSHLVRKKVNIEAIRDLLGHEKCETTVKYYVHFTTEGLEKIWKESNPYGDRS